MQSEQQLHQPNNYDPASEEQGFWLQDESTFEPIASSSTTFAHQQYFTSQLEPPSPQTMSQQSFKEQQTGINWPSMKCSQGDFQLRKLLLQELVDLQVRPIGGRIKSTSQSNQQQQSNVVINYDKQKDDVQQSDVKLLSLQDLMCWNVLIKVPTYKRPKEGAKEKSVIDVQQYPFGDGGYNSLEQSKNPFRVSKRSCHAGQVFRIKIKFPHDYPKSKPQLKIQDSLTEEFCCFREFVFMDQEEWDCFVEDAIGMDTDDNSSQSSQSSFEQYVQQQNKYNYVGIARRLITTLYANLCKCEYED